MPAKEPARIWQSFSRPLALESALSTTPTPCARSTSTTGSRSTISGSRNSAVRSLAAHPIDATLTSQFTVDHEEMDAGCLVAEYHQLQRVGAGQHHADGFEPGTSSGNRQSARRLRHYRRGHQQLGQLFLHRALVTRPALTTGLFDRHGEDNRRPSASAGTRPLSLGPPESKAKRR